MWGDVNGLLTINSVTTPLLQAGQKYWLGDEPAGSTTYTGWYFNNQGLTGNDAFSTTQGSWFNINAPGTGDSVFSISVIPVPEPSACGLLLFGAGLWAIQARRLSVKRNFKTFNPAG